MKAQKEWLAPCGLYCGVCGIRVAHANNDQKFKEKLAPIYGLKPEEIKCEGCMAEPDKVIVFCRMCHIKSCTSRKGYEGCHQCAEFPCKFVNEFPVEVGKRVIMRAIPQWREWGTEKWVEEEEKRYLCPKCGYALFRGAKRCRQCKEPVQLDD
jgi:predicted RNA-binding Zn-ribbon protein involved in translation (DUF1610 family)